MKIKINSLLLAAVTIFFFSCNPTEQKTETTEAKTAPGDFDRTVLPILPHAFAGTVDTNAMESKPDFPVEVSAPEGAPNVLVILTDVVGYGASSTFGGPVATPTLDNLASVGLRYNEFQD